MVTGLFLGIFASAYLYSSADEQIRLFVQRRLREHYPSHFITIKDARRVSSREIILRGVSISGRGPGHQQEPQVFINEMVVRCPTGIDDLIQSRIRVTRVTLRNMTVYAEHRPDGSNNVTPLLPLPKFGAGYPLIVVENSGLHYLDRRKPQPQTLKIQDINFQIARKTLPEQNPDSPPLITVQGHCSSDELKLAEFSIRFDPQTKRWNTQGNIEGLWITPDLISGLPTECSQQLSELVVLRANTNLNFQLSGLLPKSTGKNLPPEEVRPVQFAISGSLADGHLKDTRLPFDLENLSAKYKCTNQELKIEDLHAKFGRTTVEGSLVRSGLNPQSPLRLQLKAHNVHLYEYEGLLQTLPASLQSKWKEFGPAGVVSVELNAQRREKTWKPDLFVRCHNLSFNCGKFGYRLHRGTGTLRLEEKVLKIDMRALASGQPVKIDGELDPFSARGWIEARSEAPIPINQALLQTLTGHGRKIVESMNASGGFSMHYRAASNPGREKLDHLLSIELDRCSIQHAAFPYPLYKVNGLLQMENGNWTFQKLQGQNDSGHVTAHGSWERTPKGGLLQLHFTGLNLPLEEELQLALSPRARNIWRNLRPRGSISQVAVDYVHRTGQPQSITITLNEQEPRPGVRDNSISIHPTWLPYRIDDLTGQVVYRNGHWNLHEIRGKHASVQVRTSGTGQVNANGHWQCEFTDMSIDRFDFDRDLIQALPQGLHTALLYLNPHGATNLQGNIRLQGGPHHPLTSSWDLQLGMAGVSLQSRLRIEHIHGGVRLVGSYDGQQIQNRGELMIDSLMHHGIQATQIQGPFWIDDRRILIGSWANNTPRVEPPRNLSGQLFGGTVYGDGQILLDNEHNFNIKVSLSEGDLSQIKLLPASQRTQLSGKTFARLGLTGSMQGVHTLKGSGTIHLKDADIYKLPVMVALLKILSIHPPDRTAFTNSDIQFQIDGGHIYLNPVKFEGDAISLIGNGALTMNGDIDIDFYTKVGRNRLRLPVIRPLLGEASRQFVLIEVTGSLDAPVTTPQVFPGLSRFKQLFPDEDTPFRERIENPILKRNVLRNLPRIRR
ncbi:MAG: hypothetical protein CMJ81_15500 [Planctomycetaceae bacterium]|nr:hypothetical protein [Planctomycetaceae bacterium]